MIHVGFVLIVVVASDDVIAGNVVLPWKDITFGVLADDSSQEAKRRLHLAVFCLIDKISERLGLVLFERHELRHPEWLFTHRLMR
ncbi:hypothetical protein [Caballeronia sp. SBC2]|uniref:hypothetical protein n=1 Tax=Caballeronia sp. SBC2 TaxID=2705547 RepID=UPI0013EDAA75|nr:hypothetical protein [Caballeronia sp. SBC2]